MEADPLKRTHQSGPSISHTYRTMAHVLEIMTLNFSGGIDLGGVNWILDSVVNINLGGID